MPNRTRLLLPLALAVLVGVAPAGAFGQADEELARHVASMRARIEDSSVPLKERQSLVLATASTLDRAARSADSNEERLSLWQTATELIGAFCKANPTSSRLVEMELQAASYRWLTARSWLEQARLAPTDAEAAKRAEETLDNLAGSLRQLLKKAKSRQEPARIDQIRYQLAQVLSDRASLEPEGSARSQTWLNEATECLAEPIADEALRPFARLLRADILASRKQFDEARLALTSASEGGAVLPVRERLEVEVEILDGLRDWTAARGAVASADDVPENQKELFRLRIDLDECSQRPKGSERLRAGKSAFEEAERLRDKGGPLARLALIDLARSVQEPEEDQLPSAWSLLADGHLVLGQPKRAASLLRAGASRAASLGANGQAWELRFRAGAVLYQSGHDKEAVDILRDVRDDSEAGELRSKAGLLLALALGRLRRSSADPSARQEYIQALDSLIASFPLAPSTDEARWLFGQERLLENQPDQAAAVWAGIRNGSPRWLDARRALASLRLETIENPVLVEDRDEVSKLIAEARERLEDDIAASQSSTSRADLELDRLRLELSPRVEDRETANKLLERLRQSPLSTLQRQRLDLLRTVSELLDGRYAEAEEDAVRLAREASPQALLEASCLLDRLANESPSDLLRRRIGEVIQTLLRPQLNSTDVSSEPIAAEIHIRFARAATFRGDMESMRAELRAEELDPATLSPRTLRLLASSCLLMSDWENALRVCHSLGQRSPAGTLPWFEARYGMALAHEREGRPKTARQILDATAVLYSDLGGGDLRSRFEQLRERLDRE